MIRSLRNFKTPFVTCASQSMSTTVSPATTPRTVGVGPVQRTIRQGTDPSRVPSGYLPTDQQVPQETLQHLRWMLQKDSLHQDMFLVGPPSPYRRWLAMQFCELTEQEVEFVQLTRDTTESDLKQRREINTGDVLFVDQAPVRAAKEGRCLILDGVEKIERNVLPTINNLLENREMHLDDGNFMLAAERYDKLEQQGENMNGLIRVHPDFRVVALGLPIPPYPGSTLDPPLRSRFQARVVMPPSANVMLEDLLINVPTLPLPLAKKLITFVEGIRLVSEESGSSGGGGGSGGRSFVPPFPSHALRTVATILAQCELETDLVRVLARSYPYINPSMPEGSFDSSMLSLLKQVVKTYVGLNHTKGHPSHYRFPMEDSKMQFDATTLQLTVDVGNGVRMTSQGGPAGSSSSSSSKEVVLLDSHPHVLLDMYQDHSAGCDLLLVGPKGCGKSELCKHFASRLGHSPVLFSMYKDMTARDLLQRRATDSNGNTYWEPSPVVNAAINGDLVILDGLDRLSADTLSALQRLIVDREVELFDGTRLTSNALNENSSASDASSVSEPTPPVAKKHRVHPSFRIVAVACPPSTTNPWMTEEVTSWFRTTVLPSPSNKDVNQMVQTLYPSAPSETMNKALNFSKHLKDMVQKGSATEDKRAAGLGSGLSLRQLLRLARHMNSFPKTAEHSLAARIDDMLMVSVVGVVGYCGVLWVLLVLL